MANQPPTPVSYRSPGSISRRRPPFTSLGITLYLGLIVSLILGNAWFIMPRFQDVLIEFDATVPAITSAYINATQWLIRMPGLIVLLGIPIIVPPIITRFIHLTDNPSAIRYRAFAAYVFITLFAAAAVILTLLAVVLPLVQLMHSVTTPPGGQ